MSIIKGPKSAIRIPWFWLLPSVSSYQDGSIEDANLSRKNFINGCVAINLETAISMSA